MLSTQSQRIIEQLLVQSGLLTQQQLDGYKLLAVQKNVSLLTLLSEQKLVDEEELTKLSAQAAGLSYVNLSTVHTIPPAIRLLPRDTAKTYMAVPFGKTGGKLAVAMLEPTNVQAVDFIARKTGQPLIVYMASRKGIEHLLSLYGNDVTADVKAAVSSVLTPSGLTEAEAKPAAAKVLQTLVQDAPITRALNAILDSAAQSEASDVHIEPRENDLKVRFRVDGILQDTMTLPKSVEPALVSRIKILSNLKIDEHRVPQDGQFQIKAAGKDIDLRVAISPVVYGEQVIIRLLDKTTKILTLEALGFRGQAHRLITEGIHNPHGMTLSTGPTGSGKTTTMYAIIEAIKNIAVNIVTLEDPVEYRIDGINQIQVNPDVGLTFATGLRSILRQDPNIIMVGEIRDQETAELAVQAALTGHVVLSTLHTNSAAGVLPRLLDMQIEPYLIASTVNTVIGQRLVRQLCQKCRVTAQSTPTETASISTALGAVLPKTQTDVAKAAKDMGYDNLPTAGQSAYTLYRPKGCPDCISGYKGRLGIYEVFALTGGMEKLLTRRATTGEVQAQAQADGMLTMKQDGYLKALAGLTTIEEVARVAADT